MEKEKLEFENGVTAVVTDDGANLDLEINWPIPAMPGYGRTLHLRAKKVDVQRFLDVILAVEEEESEDVPDQQANGGGSQESSG